MSNNPQYIRVADLPLGSQIILGKNKFNGKFQNGEEDIVWIVVSKDHFEKDDGYPKNAVTVITKDVIRYMAFDAKEPNNVIEARRNFGNNRWRTSNIRQWLNSNSYAKQWFTPQNIGESGTDNKDTPPTAENLINIARNYPYDVDEGFMRFFTSAEMNVILPAKIKTVIPSDSEGQDPMTPKLEETEDYFYLPSITEITGGNFVHGVNYPKEGAKVLVDANSPYRNARATQLALVNGAYYSYSINTDKDYVYRSPANNSEILKYFDDGLNGSYVKSKPADNFGIRPMTNIKYDAVVVETEEAGVYKLVDNAKPYIVIDSVGQDTNGYDLNFTVYDYDDNIHSVYIEVNNERVNTYNVGNVKNYSDTYVIPYNKLHFGTNRLIIRAIDTRNKESVKTLELELISENAVKNGDIIATKDGLYTVINTFINENGVLELSLDRNLKSVQYKGKDIVENYLTRYVPSVFINNDFTAIPQYYEMELESIDYNTNDGTATEEWIIHGVGKVVHTKVDMTRREEKENDITVKESLSRVSQMFSYYDD